MGPVERVVRPRSNGNAAKPKALNTLTNSCSWKDAAENNEQRTQRHTRHKPRVSLDATLDIAHEGLGCIIALIFGWM